MEQCGTIVKKLANTLVRKVGTFISITLITTLVILGNNAAGVERIIHTGLTEVGCAAIHLSIDYVPTRQPISANITKTICGFVNDPVYCSDDDVGEAAEEYKTLSKTTTTINFPHQREIHQTDKLKLGRNYDEAYWDITETFPEGEITHRLGYTGLCEIIRYDDAQFQLIGHDVASNTYSFVYINH